MSLSMENKGNLKVHNQAKLETILYGNILTLLTKPSKYAVEESNNAKPRNTDQTCYAPNVSNNSKINCQPVSAELSRLSLNERWSEDDILGGKSQTDLSSDASFTRRKASNIEPPIYRMSKYSSPDTSELVASRSLLNEKAASTEIYYEPYIARKKKFSLQKASDFREFKEKYDELLNKDYMMKQEIDLKLNSNEMKKKKHQENIYKQWIKVMYNPLNNKIQESIQSPHCLFAHGKKHETYKNYLKYVNTKGYVYLDTVDPEEYSIYPYPYKVPGKVNGKVPDNPLHYTSQQYDEELQVILSLLTGKNYSRNDIEKLKLFSHPVSSSSRQKMDAAKWLLMPENNILSTPRAASRRKIHPGRYNRSILSESLLNKYKIIENQKPLILQNNRLEEI